MFFKGEKLMFMLTMQNALGISNY